LELARRLRRVESRNVTHLRPDFPVFWEAAAGANVRDVDGNIFLDLTGAFGVSVAGHGNPVVGGSIHGAGRRGAVAAAIPERCGLLRPSLDTIMAV